MGLRMLVLMSVLGCSTRQQQINFLEIINTLKVIQELYTSSNTNNGTKASLFYLNGNNEATNANANISSKLQSVVTSLM